METKELINMVVDPLGYFKQHLKPTKEVFNWETKPRRWKEGETELLFVSMESDGYDWGI